MLAILLAFKEAVLVVEGVWEVGRRVATVLGEAKIDFSAVVDTRVQVRFV